MLNQNKKKHGFEYTQKFYVMEQNQSIFGFNEKMYLEKWRKIYGTNLWLTSTIYSGTKMSLLEFM